MKTVLTALTVFLSTLNLLAAPDNDKVKTSYELNEQAINNFLSGLKSDNPGLRKSCIYFSGKYKINKALFPLMEQLRKEKDPDTKILIANSLYQIGDGRGIYLIKTMAEKDSNSKVQRRCGALYNEYLQSDLGLAAL